MYTEFDYASQVSANPNPRTTQEFNLRQAAADKFNAAKARLAGSPKVQGAVNAAKGAYGSASKYLGPAGVVLSAGMEAKDRLDRGEDGQRAATGALANAGGAATGAATGATAGAAIGSFVPVVGTAIGGIAGGILGGIAGGAAAGYATDRVTDAVRGNDGKGTDAVLKDMAGQIESARAGGNFARAAQLTQEAMQFQSKRMGQGQPGYAEARGMGIAEGDVETFKGLQSQQAMSKALTESQFQQQYGFNDRTFGQELGFQRQRNDEQSRIAEIERRKIQAVTYQDAAAKTMFDIQRGIPGSIERQATAALQGVYANYRGV